MTGVPVLMAAACICCACMIKYIKKKRSSRLRRAQGRSKSGTHGKLSKLDDVPTRTKTSRRSLSKRSERHKEVSFTLEKHVERQLRKAPVHAADRVTELSQQQNNAESSNTGFGSITHSPRASPDIDRSDKSMEFKNSGLSTKNDCSIQCQQTTLVIPSAKERVEQNTDQQQLCHVKVEVETKRGMEFKDKTTDKDRQTDLQVFDNLYSNFSSLTNEDVSALCIQLQTNYSSTNFAAGVFDHTGGHLPLPRHDIVLFVPPGAIEDGKLQTIYIFVPPSSVNDGKPAPIVHCGPTGTTFLDHVILSFPVDSNHDEIIPKFTNTEVGSEEEWHPLHENDDAAFIVRNGKCILYLSHFTGFGADAKDKTSLADVQKTGEKIIRVGAFASEQTSDNRLYKLRIRFYDSSADARERMCAKEMSHFGGRLLDDDRRMHVDRQGGKLCVQVSKIAAGWRAVDDSDEKQMLPSSEALGGSLTPTQAFLHQQGELRPNNRPFPILPLEVRHEMCVLLDVETRLGNDWRMMAEKLEIDSPTITWIGRQMSPTSKLLDFWETENVSGGTVALQRLSNIFKEIGRPDVQELIKNTYSNRIVAGKWGRKPLTSGASFSSK
uniref:Netrin receptor UNC5 n=1 Tax=Branchiostoma floridae TaxID=7739 RepID=C3YNJ7_BRAFL|eukprot:XP_002602291.1 hypothetical protein BRAFLDRAFT_76983 [Branchiostoma floridae]